MEAWCIGVKPCEWPSSSRLWVSAGVRTWSEGKGPANAEWQFIIPDRYISICPAAPRLPLWACCHHQAFQQRWTHAHTHKHDTNTPNNTALCSKQSLGAESNQNRGYRVPQGMISNCDSFWFVHIFSPDIKPMFECRNQVRLSLDRNAHVMVFRQQVSMFGLDRMIAS